MDLKLVLLVILLSISSSLAQIGPAFFGAAFPSGFVSPFSDFGSLTNAQPGANAPPSPTNTGPIVFPPAPESRDTSGVVIGASGYGFVPPGGKGITQGRGFVPPPTVASAFSSPYGNSPFDSPFFHL